jgi:hypothetical protein
MCHWPLAIGYWLLAANWLQLGLGLLSSFFLLPAFLLPAVYCQSTDIQHSYCLLLTAYCLLLTGDTGSLCEQQPLKALRAPCGPIPQYKILCCYIISFFFWPWS